MFNAGIWTKDEVSDEFSSMARDAEKILTDPSKDKRLNIKNKDAKEGGKGITLALATNLSFCDIVEKAYKNTTWNTGVRPMLSRFTII